MSSERVRLPADVEMDDRLAFGLSARQLSILAVAALLSYLIFSLASGVLPAPVAVVLAAPVAFAGLALALGRLHGLSGDRIAAAAAHHLAEPRRRVAAEALPRPLPHAPRGPRVALLNVPVRAIRHSGVIELADSTSALLLAASGTSFALRSDDEQAAVVESFGRWLNSLTEPTAITVRSQPVDLGEQARAIEDAAAGLPHPALERFAHTYAQFLTELAEEGEGLRRRRILIVLSAHGTDEAAASDLRRRAGETAGLLAAAGVEIEVLDGQHATELLIEALEPPGPPTGSYVEGVIHRCP